MYSKPNTVADNPPSTMVTSAIKKLEDSKGSSHQAILQCVVANNKVVAATGKKGAATGKKAAAAAAAAAGKSDNLHFTTLTLS